MDASKRILVGQIWHEGHSFNPVLTVEEDFVVTRSGTMLAQARTMNTALGGIVRALERQGHHAVPTLAALSRPGGAIADDFFLPLIDEILDAARSMPFDAICLDLHGATTTESILDVEGEILERLRGIVGDEMPIAVALDLHAYVTPRMVKHATILTGFRTVPHADMVETGERALLLLDRLMKEGISPRAAMLRVPLLTRGNDETARGPLVAIGKAADAWRAKADIFDVSVFNVHHFLDVPEYGQVVLAYDRGDGGAPVAAEELGELLWAARDQFVEQLPSVADTFERARATGLPIAVGDQGDRVMGGGPGDSTEIASFAMVNFPDLAVAVPIYDPGAVSQACAAGVGATVRLALGAGITPQCEPLTADWTVLKTGRASFVNKGPYMGGVLYDFGPAAVLQKEKLTVVVTTCAPNVHDPAFFEAMGIDVQRQNILVTKAANHYKLSFAGVTDVLTIDTKGLTAFRPQDFPFSLSRPFYPLDDFAWQAAGAVVIRQARPLLTVCRPGAQPEKAGIE